jgi:hypothetical protein
LSGDVAVLFSEAMDLSGDTRVLSGEALELSGDAQVLFGDRVRRGLKRLHARTNVRR